MNSQEAIETLKELNENYFSDGFDDANEAIELAISALEKQIPKKPIRKKWSVSRCPSCNAELGEYTGDGYHRDWESLKTCNCGQKLDWEE